MPTYLSRAIAADGVDLLSGTQIIYAAVQLTTIDPEVRRVDPLNPDHFVRAGWLSFGDLLDPFGAGPELYWQPPIWIDWTRLLWTPSPASSAAGVFLAYGTRIRWHLTGTTAGNLFVFGL